MGGELGEMVGVLVGLVVLAPAGLLLLVSLVTGWDEAREDEGAGAQWERDVERMYRAWERGDAREVRYIRESMGYPPAGHKPSAEAHEKLVEMGKYGGV